MSAPKNWKGLFNPIGLGSLKAKSLLDMGHDGVIIERRPLTEKDAAKPCQGELWIEFEILWGHFNGPKQRHTIITNGEIIKAVISDNETRQIIDSGLEQYIRHLLDDIF